MGFNRVKFSGQSNQGRKKLRTLKTFEQELDDEFDANIRVNKAFIGFAIGQQQSTEPTSSNHKRKKNDNEEEGGNDYNRQGPSGLNWAAENFRKQLLSLCDLTEKDEKEGQEQQDDNSSIVSLESNPNDQLLFDPNADDRDQEFVNSMRPSQIEKDAGPETGSDAVLNCPCCMSLLCLDCQRHEIYLTQYRAMFVRNCSVNRNSSIEFSQKYKKRRRKNEENQQDQVFNSVLCSICGTQVAAYEPEQELYHFYNVVASHS